MLKDSDSTQTPGKQPDIASQGAKTSVPGSSLAETLEQRLRQGPGEWVPLEDFTSFPQCLEWRLAREYWELHGPRSFFGGEVPYACINDGRLSIDAARFLAEICPEAKN